MVASACQDLLFRHIEVLKLSIARAAQTHSYCLCAVVGMASCSARTSFVNLPMILPPVPSKDHPSGILFADIDHVLPFRAVAVFFVVILCATRSPRTPVFWTLDGGLGGASCGHASAGDAVVDVNCGVGGVSICGFRAWSRLRIASSGMAAFCELVAAKCCVMSPCVSGFAGAVFSSAPTKPLSASASVCATRGLLKPLFGVFTCLKWLRVACPRMLACQSCCVGAMTSKLSLRPLSSLYIHLFSSSAFSLGLWWWLDCPTLCQHDGSCSVSVSALLVAGALPALPARCTTICQPSDNLKEFFQF